MAADVASHHPPLPLPPRTLYFVIQVSYALASTGLEQNISPSSFVICGPCFFSVQLGKGKRMLVFVAGLVFVS